jgi:uncharacterized protein (TIGR02391 family)
VIAPLDDSIVEAASKALGDAVTGSELNRFLGTLGLVDRSGESTKWRRICFVFIERQKLDRSANKFGEFIERVASPGRWVSRRSEFAFFRDDINGALLLAGLRLRADGKLDTADVAKTIDESAIRANRLRSLLEARGIHANVLRCTQQLVLHDNNYFHAVFEATKSVFERLRQLSGSHEDGNRLIGETLECSGHQYPMIALNNHNTPSLKNEQQGIAHLARGLAHAFRNVPAHEPQITWTIHEADALDMMSIASLIHRRLDGAARTR